MTTRKLGAFLPLLVALASAAFGEAGCATPGPLHVYSIASATAPEMTDSGPAPTPRVSTFLASDETITGFAYDPFTDHFFLRLAPGNHIRVVDRPAQAIKREFTIAEVPATGGGDLAVKPLTGHIFLLHPTEPVVIETTRLGQFVRTFTLAGLAAPGAGIAYDAVKDQLLILVRGERPQVLRYKLDGESAGGGVTLERAVAASFAFDAAVREFYAPITASPAIGVFDETGKLLRTVPAGASVVDVGPRSFLRMF